MKIRSLLPLFALFMAFPGYAGWTSDYHTTVSLTPSPTGSGKVYASASSDAPADTDYKDSFSSTLKTSQSGSENSAPDTHDQTIYLFAKPNTGYRFDKWTDANNQTVDATSGVTVTGNKTESSAPTVTFTANFIPCAVAAQPSDPALGSVAVTPRDNNVGDQVTLKATKVSTSSHNKFLGWYDQGGNLCSTDAEWTFTVGEVANYTARFQVEHLLQGPGYYRVKCYSSGNTYLSMVGKWPISFSVTAKSCEGVLHGHHGNNQYTYDPAGIIYLSGNAETLESNEADKKAMSGVSLESCGVSTQSLFNKTFDIEHRGGNFAGYYKVVNSLVLMVSFYQDPPIVQLGRDKTTEADYPPEMTIGTRSFEFQPIDEEHIDQYYFGAKADASTLDDEGFYWATMYAGFPYRVYDPTVAAYYVSGFDDAAPASRSEGGKEALLTQFPDNEVPAGTPALIRCRSTIVAENRLLPLPKGSVEPLPEGANMLRGDYHLFESEQEFTEYKKGNAPASWAFEASQGMRAIGRTSADETGFTSTATANWTKTSNAGSMYVSPKVWLDASSLSQDGGAAAPDELALRLPDDRPTGLEDVLGNGAAELQPIGPDTILYDVSGRCAGPRSQVSAPGLYITRDGRKLLVR